jgi:hypothetical protein
MVEARSEPVEAVPTCQRCSSSAITMLEARSEPVEVVPTGQRCYSGPN